MTASPKPRPIVPYLTCTPAAEAIAWYQRALGAEPVGQVHPMGPGSDLVGHAELRIDGRPLYLSDEHVPVGAVSPTTAGASTVALVLEVDDVDAAFERAVGAGALGDRPPAEGPGGARSAWFRDPFGHRWNVHGPVPSE